jgi:hypothetical protein
MLRENGYSEQASQWNPKDSRILPALRRRVPWIQEADGAAVIEAAKDAVIVENVKAS